VVDAILTGVHERGTSHFELLRAFADDLTLMAADEEMAAHGYRHHEFGDSVLVIPALGVRDEGKIRRSCRTRLNS
jgi:S-adenosylmethionine:tRNA ribosyltransferase-isomerase